MPLNTEINFLQCALNSLETDTPQEEPADSPVVFYCKDCKAMTEVEKKPNKLSFRCKKCRSERIAFGTKNALENFYHIHS